MKIMKILPVLLVFPAVVYGATRDSSAVRVGVGRLNQVASRMPAIAGVVVNSKSVQAEAAGDTQSSVDAGNAVVANETAVTTETSAETKSVVAESSSSELADCEDVGLDARMESGGSW